MMSKHDLFWHLRDFDDPLLGFIDVLDGGETLPYGDILFDYNAAQTPEEASLPKSYWTKERILTYARMAKTVVRGAEKKLKKMPLEELQAVVLKWDGKDITGRRRAAFEALPGEKGEWRHTDFYSIDVEMINKLAGGTA
ncbi:hypothetical protein TALC_00361 [Thermoplasmatales archaeon BRNA1]|nr:hypothetical protein TALC_00361 [Thermoplasmatales archaeon BRNA1]